MSRVKSNLMSQVKRGKMNQQQVDKLLSKLKGTLSYDDFKTVDMVVEAVIESIDLKQKIFAGKRRCLQQSLPVLTAAGTCKSVQQDVAQPAGGK